MNEERITETPSWKNPRGQVMKTPDDVAEMLRLRACGWGLKRIARQLGCSHHTVKDYVATGGVKQKDRRGGHRKHRRSKPTRNKPRQRREPDPVSRLVPRTRNVATQDRVLMSDH